MLQGQSAPLAADPEAASLPSRSAPGFRALTI